VAGPPSSPSAYLLFTCKNPRSDQLVRDVTDGALHRPRVPVPSEPDRGGCNRLPSGRRILRCSVKLPVVAFLVASNRP
jgi:hypothetical protein